MQLSLDALISKAWNDAYAGVRPEATLLILRQRLQDVAFDLQQDRDTLARACDKLLQAWDDFPADMRDRYFAPVFTPTVIAALPDDTLRALAQRPLPNVPGRATALEQLLVQELDVRSPLGLERAMRSVFKVADLAFQSLAASMDMQYERVIDHWSSGHHLLSLWESLNTMQRDIAAAITPQDVSHITAVTGTILLPGSFSSWRSILELVKKKRAGVPFVPEEALERFSIWSRARAGAAQSLEQSVDNKEAGGQLLLPSERVLKKFVLIQRALQYLEDVKKMIAVAWKERKKVHDPVRDGVVLMDQRGRPIEVLDIVGLRLDNQTWLNDLCKDGEAGLQGKSPEEMTKAIIDASRPFLMGQRPPRDRARLYDAVACRPFTEKDCRVPQESVMVGQNMLAAARDIRPWECFGAYAGYLLSDERTKDMDRTYFYEASPEGEDSPTERRFSIDGCNAMCRMNTLVIYDENGRPKEQAEHGFNAEGILLQVRLGENMYGVEQICLPAFFNASDTAINAGDELRLDYGYTPDLVHDM